MFFSTKKIEEELKADHQEAMQGLMMANRASLDAMRHDYENAKNEELRQIKNLHSEELGKSKMKMTPRCIRGYVLR